MKRTLAPGARALSRQHLSIRVPWHDSGWAGTVCRQPLANLSCLVLKNIAESRQDSEAALAGRSLADLPPDQWPPCVDERATFLGPFQITRPIVHPYTTASPHSHGHLRPALFPQPPYSAPAIPFDWLRRSHVEGEDGKPGLAERYQLGFAPEREPVLDFSRGKAKDGGDEPGTWVNERDNQLCLLDTFFSAIHEDDSLCFFYAKRTPLAEDRRRTIIAVGLVSKIGEPVEYPGGGSGALRAVTFERSVSHTIRPKGGEGFVMPYAAILTAAEEDPSIDPARCVAFVSDDHRDQFSFVAEHVSHDAAIGALLSCHAALERAREIPGVDTEGPTAWINRQLNRLWTMRGPHPGFGSALTALGVPRGTLVAHALSLAQSERGKANEDPWVEFEKALSRNDRTGIGQYLGADIRRLYQSLPSQRRALLQLLSRFALSEEQAKRLYVKTEREDAGLKVTDAELLANPYLIYELDRTSTTPIPLQTVDRGLFPEAAVRERHPLPVPSALEGPLDPRRIRAFVVQALEDAAGAGHTLQMRDDVIRAVRSMDVQPSVPLSEDSLAVAGSLEPHVRILPLDEDHGAFQLERFATARELIRAEVQKRTKGKRHAGDPDWRRAVDSEFRGEQPPDEEELRARTEKAAALEELYRSRLTVLLGPAGTGKTKLLKMFCELPEVKKGRILLLAPTGKARVRLEQQTGIRGGKTIAELLLPLGRYNPETFSYLTTGDARREKAETVVVDECSMVTEEQLAALVDGLSGVQRLVLVGDPRQLPPIGAGRPFVDLVAALAPENIDSRFPKVGPGYAELTVNRRQGAAAGREDMALAHWFSGRPPDPSGDEVWDPPTGGPAGALRLVEWSTPSDLQHKLLAVLRDELKLAGPDEVQRFEQSLGGTLYQGLCYFRHAYGEEPGAASKAEAWQILSPVHAGLHGVASLNRLIQLTFRAKTKELALRPKFQRRTPGPVGPQAILYGDKVICTTNASRRSFYPRPEGENSMYVANGDLGIVVGQFKTKNMTAPPWKLEVELVTRPGVKIDFFPNEFGDEGVAPLELAYALTVHRTQGSEFGTTFVVVPNPCRLLSRELLYTAITRHRNRLVLFHQGQLRDLRQFAGGDHSETARRLTNLFADPTLVEHEGSFYEERLIHRTQRGDLVRSKSEVIIADALHAAGLDYQYEQELLGTDGRRKYPDFTIEDAASGVTVIWEHLGMLADPEYRHRWEKKLAWYRQNGVLSEAEGGGERGVLLVTQDTAAGGIDSGAIAKVVKRVFKV